MSALEEELMESEELDYEYDLDEVQKQALLSRPPLQEDENDAIELGIEKVLPDLNEDQTKEEVHSQTQYSAGSVHSRLGPQTTPSEQNDHEQDENDRMNKNEEVGHIQPQQKAGSVHSRLGPRETPSEQQNYEKEEMEDKQEIHEDYQQNEVSEDLERDEKESGTPAEEEEEEEDEDDDDEDESPRRGRFKSERFKSEKSKITPTISKSTWKIPDSLDDVVIKNDVEVLNEHSKRGRGARGGRGWQNRGRRGQGMDWGRLGHRAGPWGPQPGPYNRLPEPQGPYNRLPEPIAPYGYQNDRFQMDDYGPYDGIMFSKNNAGEAEQQLQNQNSPRPMPLMQSRGSIWSRLGMPPSTQTGVTPMGASQEGHATTVSPQIIPAGAHTTALLKRPHANNATDSTASVKQMKLEIQPGKNAVSILNEKFPGKIKFHEKSIGTVHVPEFECSVEVEGQLYKGVAKQKKVAKKNAAEAALQARMQNVPMNNAVVAGQQSRKMTPQENKAFQNLQQKVLDTKNVPMNNTEVAGQQLSNQNPSRPMTPLENVAFQNLQQKVSETNTVVTPVAASQADDTTPVTPQNGTTTPLEKDITPDVAQTTTLLTEPNTDLATGQQANDDIATGQLNADNATVSTDLPNQMKLELPPGKPAISILNEMYMGKIKFNEKAIGNIKAPEFECCIEIEGQTYLGVGKQKKVAKKKAAEVTLLALMQNWSKGILPGPGHPQAVMKQLMDAQLQQQQQKDMTKVAEP